MRIFSVGYMLEFLGEGVVMWVFSLIYILGWCVND